MLKRSRAAGFGALALLGLTLAVIGRPVHGEDLGTWTEVPKPTPHPIARSGATLATYQGAGVLYGGLSPDITLTDIWSFASSNGAYKRLNSTTPIPPGRYGHASTVQGIRMYTFFGHGSDGNVLSDVWYYDFPQTCWEPLPPTGDQPPARAEHSAVTQSADFILVFGGRASDDSLLDDLWRYEPFTKHWVQKASFPDGGRAGHVGVFLAGKMYVLGGTSAGGAQNDVWCYDPGMDSWSELPTDGDVPSTFTGSSGAVGDFERNGGLQIMIVGGKNGSNSAITATYLVTIDGQGAHWKLQTSQNAGFQGAAAAVKPSSGSVTASNLLIFGGLIGGEPIDTGFVFAKTGPVGPDLSIKTLSIKKKAIGKGAKLRWNLSGTAVVQNGGTVKAGASALRLQLSADADYHNGDPLLKQLSVKAINPGKTLKLKWAVTLPLGQTVSTKYVVAVVDVNAQVAEINETNNTPSFGPIP